MSKPGNHHSDFEAYRADLEAVERRVAGEIEPGGRALAVLAGVFVLLVSFLLPHTGPVRGWDVLVPRPDAAAVEVTLPSRLFMWLAVVFGVGFSLLALLTRRWVIAWVTMAGSMTASAAGLLAVWSRQTASTGQPGPGIGLVIGWLTVIVLTFHWARVVWSRTVVQLAAEAQRRDAAARHQTRGILDDFGGRNDPGGESKPKSG